MKQEQTENIKPSEIRSTDVRTIRALQQHLQMCFEEMETLSAGAESLMTKQNQISDVLCSAKDSLSAYLFSTKRRLIPCKTTTT